MVVRSALRCSPIRRLHVRRPWPPGAKQRKYSTASPLATSHRVSSTSMLGVFTDELDKISPRFEINGSDIQILRSPVEFYESLKVDIISTFMRSD